MTLEEHVHDNLLDGSRGHFAYALANAWCYADSGNRAKLEAAFPHIFTVPKD
jgi:hypothetical protein